MIIREVQLSDAEALLQLNLKLDEETKFMLFEPDERKMAVDEQKCMIKSVLESPNSTIFVCERDGELIGFVAAIGGKQKRNAHKAHLVAGVLQAYSGKGIGTRLFLHLERWAKENGVKRLELTVMSHNKRAIALYHKMGFTIEGEKKCSLIVDGDCVDEYVMGRLL